MKTKTIQPNTICANALEFLIKHKANNRGVTSKIAQALSAITGETVYRQQVEKWLHEVPAERIEPKGGMLLLLLAVGQALCGNQRHILQDVVSSIPAAVLKDLK